ncbi:GYD domain-containing protein [Micromonospora sp. NPDC050200]|uniref:GYD domain-containing protein n=1 Tax=Micromonospora sp. NPDC050200 TaxID=3155664 RepID=UPI0033E8E698
MAKFLLKSSYTVEGLRGLSKDGGTKRAEIVRAMIENLGGRMESLHFGFDEQHDTYVVCELPNHETAAAMAIAIRVTGGLETRITPILTAEEVDEATRIRVVYEPPGR